METKLRLRPRSITVRSEVTVRPRSTSPEALKAVSAKRPSQPVPAGTGWLGRFADTAFSASGDVLRGLTVTSDLTVMLRGLSRSFVSIPSAGGYVYPAYLFSGATMPDAALIETGWGNSLTAASADPGYIAAAQAGKLFFDAVSYTH